MNGQLCPFGRQMPWRRAIVLQILSMEQSLTCTSMMSKGFLARRGGRKALVLPSLVSLATFACFLMPIKVVLNERASTVEWIPQEKQGLYSTFLGRCRLTVENVRQRVSRLSLDADMLDSKASIFAWSQQGKQGPCSTFLGRRRFPTV